MRVPSETRAVGALRDTRWRHRQEVPVFREVRRPGVSAVRGEPFTFNEITQRMRSFLDELHEIFSEMQDPVSAARVRSREGARVSCSPREFAALFVGAGRWVCSVTRRWHLLGRPFSNIWFSLRHVSSPVSCYAWPDSPRPYCTLRWTKSAVGSLVYVRFLAEAFSVRFRLLWRSLAWRG